MKAVFSSEVDLRYSALAEKPSHLADLRLIHFYREKPMKFLIMLGCAIMTSSVITAAITVNHPSRLHSLAAELDREITRLETEVRQLREDNATLRQRLGMDTTPPIPPVAERPDKVWLCGRCGRPVRLTYGPLDPRHIGGEQDHPAELSNADLKMLADRLRMGD